MLKFRFHSVTKSVKKLGDKEDGVATVNLGLKVTVTSGTNYNSAISKRLLGWSRKAWQPPVIWLTLGGLH